MRVGKGSDLIGQHMEKSTRMVLEGSGMKVNGRTGGVMVMNVVMPQFLGVPLTTCQLAEFLS